MTAVRRTKAGALTERVARLLFGAPSGIDSEKGQVRFGDIGVDLKSGRFFDFDDEVGGDHLQLIQRVKGLQNGQAEEWFKTNVTDAKLLPLPPESEAERALIGLLAMRPEMMAAVEEEITVDHLTEIVHRQLFTAIAESEQIAGKPISMKALMNAAGGDPLLPVFDYTLAGYVAKLVADAQSPPDAAHFARELAIEIRSEANREGAVDDQYDKELEQHGNGHDREAPPREGEQEQKPLIVSSADFVSGFIPPDYLVDGLLQKRFCYSLTGPTGSGKSAIALLISAHVALGKPIAERGVETGRVLYLAGENPDDIQMRWIAMADQMEFDVGTIGVYFLPGVFKVSEIAGRINKEVQAIGPVALVVVDTSAAYFEGDDENNNVQQGAHARRLRTLTKLSGRPTVLIACHPVKNATIENLIPKGGGNFINEVDGNLTAWKTDSTTAIHWQGKFRGAEFAPLTFQLHTATTKRLTDSKGRLIPTVVAASMSENEQIRIETKSRSDEDQLLVSVLENERTSLKTHAAILDWKTKSGELNKALVNRTANNLKKSKLVTTERRGLALTAKGLKEAKLVKSNLARAGELISRDKLL